MIDPKKMTEKTQEALIAAQQAAQENGRAQLDVEDLFAALLEQQGGIVPSVIEALGGSTQQLLAATQQELARQPKVQGNVQLSASGRLGRVLTQAQKEADALKDDFVSTEHLLLAMAQDQGYTGQALARIGATHERVLNALREVRGNQRVTDQNPENKYQALEKYGRDLTELAQKNKMDPVIGRDEEIRRVIQVLSRRTKNNPVLIGEPGVGKTAIVEGLAQRIISGDVPEILKNKRVVGLDLGSMLAGAKYRGEFEDRLKAVLKEIEDSNGQIVLFIPDRFLPDKAIDLIDEAASSLRIQIDSMPTEIDQLERRATQLEIEKQALKKEDDANSKERLSIVERELAQIREQANALKVRWKEEKEAITKIRQLKERIEQLKIEEQQAERTGNLERVASIRYGELRQAEAELARLSAQADDKKRRMLKEEVDEEDVAAIVSKWTGIPVSKMLEGEVKKLVNMEERLRHRIVGQDAALARVSNAGRRAPARARQRPKT